MALSSGVRGAAGMAAGWLAVAGASALGLIYFSEIQDSAHSLFRVGPRSDSQAVQARRPPGVGPEMHSNGRGRTVEIRAGTHGHHYASVEINGRPIDVMVDTGASIVALTFEDAERAGLFIRDGDYTHRVNTANGLARIAPVTLDRVSIGEIMVRNVPAAVSEPGKLTTSLLGMSFLSRLQRVDMRRGVLVLQE
jgi:aspartyl protease family protein